MLIIYQSFFFFIQYSVYFSSDFFFSCLVSFSSSIEKLFSEYKDLKEKIKNYDFKFLGELKFNQGIILNMLNSISLGNSGEIYFGDREKRVSENFEKAKECEIEKQAEEKNIRIRNSRNDW